MVESLDINHRKGILGFDALLGLGHVNRRQGRVDMVIDLAC